MSWSSRHSLREKEKGNEKFSTLDLLRVLGQGTVADLFEGHVYEHVISDAEEGMARAEIGDVHGW